MRVKVWCLALGLGLGVASSASAEEPDALVAFCDALSGALVEAAPSCDAMAEAATGVLEAHAEMLEVEGVRLSAEAAAGEACREAMAPSQAVVMPCIEQQHAGLAEAFMVLQAYTIPPAEKPTSEALLAASDAFATILEGLAAAGQGAGEACEAQRDALVAWLGAHQAELEEAAARFAPILRYEEESGGEVATAESQARIDAGIAAWDAAGICEKNTIILLEVLGRLGI